MTTSRGVRRFLAMLLLPVALGCGRGEEAWRARLVDPDPNIRRAAVREVASTVESTTAISALTAALQDTDEKVQVAAALGLLRVEPNNPDSRPVIERALKGGQGPVFVTLGATGKDADWAVPTLITLLKDQKTAVRALAAKTLGEIGVASEPVNEALRHGLRDANEAVRIASQRAIDRLLAKETGAAQR